MELLATANVAIHMQTQVLVNGAAIERVAASDTNHLAILLDVDGTLIELGPTPFEVHVPDELRVVLKQLSEMTGGALALVSGRPIKDLDILFDPLKLPAIGGHGAEMRLHQTIRRMTPLLSDSLRAQLSAAAGLRPGVVVEDKGYSVALHYRKVPQYENWLVRHIVAVCKAHADEVTEVLPGKLMFEVKRPAVNKGESVRHLMKLKPFVGRHPLFIGDDVTDESVFEVMPDLGGLAFSVTRKVDGLAGIFDSPAQVRQALYRLANGRKYEQFHQVP
ncbi:MAG TPA: trehalose-phosphatase [Pseudolabrys sp.]